jgi:hypothetical protein
MNMSTPLFRYSYRPAVNIWVIREQNYTSRRRTDIEGVVQIEIVVTVEMASDKLVYFCFGG